MEPERVDRLIAVLRRYGGRAGWVVVTAIIVAAGVMLGRARLAT